MGAFIAATVFVCTAVGDLVRSMSQAHGGVNNASSVVGPAVGLLVGLLVLAVGVYEWKLARKTAPRDGTQEAATPGPGERERTTQQRPT